MSKDFNKQIEQSYNFVRSIPQLSDDTSIAKYIDLLLPVAPKYKIEDLVSVLTLRKFWEPIDEREQEAFKNFVFKSVEGEQVTNFFRFLERDNSFIDLEFELFLIYCSHLEIEIDLLKSKDKTKLTRVTKLAEEQNENLEEAGGIYPYTLHVLQYHEVAYQHVLKDFAGSRDALASELAIKFRNSEFSIITVFSEAYNLARDDVDSFYPYSVYLEEYFANCLVKFEELKKHYSFQSTVSILENELHYAPRKVLAPSDEKERIKSKHYKIINQLAEKIYKDALSKSEQHLITRESLTNYKEIRSAFKDLNQELSDASYAEVANMKNVRDLFISWKTGKPFYNSSFVPKSKRKLCIG